MGGQTITRWDLLSTPELDRVARGTPVVLPIAATEQHGPHLPLATDRLIVDYLVAELDQRLGEGVLILPTIAVGCSDSHLSFAGTLSVAHETLLGYIEAIIDSVFAAGFSDVIVLNAHGGNQGVTQVAFERLGTRHADRRVAWTSWWRLAGPELLSVSESGPGGVGHACELETSIMLVLAPDLVHGDLAPERANAPAIDYDDGDMLRAGRVSLYRRSEQIAPSGVFGDPRRASRETGQAALAVIADALERLVLSLAE